MIHILRKIVYVVFALTTVVFAISFINHAVKVDKTYPVITIDKDIIEVPIGVGEKELLKGVTAEDGKDGDLTNKIIVESISKFSEIGTCKVTYAVCDSDNHVASATRKIKYKNYKSPQFDLKRSFCYSLYENINVLNDLTAQDCLDGNISSNIITTSNNFEGGKVGLYTINAKVTNSKGDFVEVNLPMVVEDRNINAPTIKLKDYLVYSKKGKSIDFNSYFIGATDSFDKSVSNTLRIDSDFNKNKPGVYSVHYFVHDSIDRQGHAIMIVIVE